MGSFTQTSATPTTADQRSDEFDSVVTYLSAISQRLSQIELLDVADTLHELIRRRKAVRQSWRADRDRFIQANSRSYSS